MAYQAPLLTLQIRIRDEHPDPSLPSSTKPFSLLDPESVNVPHPPLPTKIRIRDEHSGSYFRELRNYLFFGLKILKFL
jgi:hypothetical protein